MISAGCGGEVLSVAIAMSGECVLRGDVTRRHAESLYL